MGRNSVLYGSNAIAGVINIITKDPGGPSVGAYSISAGSNRLRSSNFGYTGETADGKLGYRISLDSMDVSPPSEFDEYRSNSPKTTDYENLTGSGSLFIDFRTRQNCASIIALSKVQLIRMAIIHLFTDVDGRFGTDTDQYLASLTVGHKMSEHTQVEFRQRYYANYRDTFAEVLPTYYYDGKRHVSEASGIVNLKDNAYLSCWW